MNDRAWIATRKGLFELRRRSSAWHVAHISFLGDPVTMLLPPQPSGRMLAALNLGHFGVKLHASDDEGRGWNEVAVPTYPEQPADAAGPAWKLVLLWSLEAVGGEIWAGTIPGDLYSRPPDRRRGKGCRDARNSRRWHNRRGTPGSAACDLLPSRADG